MSAIERTGEINPELARQLRSATPARVALRKTGVSLATSELLDFQLAHGRARDAVHAELQPSSIVAELRSLGRSPILLHSAAQDRKTYLQRPDLGRKLDQLSRDRLLNQSQEHSDISIVIVDGLSALAVERHALPLLGELLPFLAETPIRLAPICVVEQGRVAIGDEIAEILCAHLAVVLIGERPGLSSPDSLGAYITWAPHPGCSNSERNCISNIRTEGLSYWQATSRLLFYIHESRRLQLTGVALKESDTIIPQEIKS